MSEFFTLTNFNLLTVFEIISDIILIVAAFNYIRNITKVNLDFSFGSVKVRRKDINSSNLTNIVSQYFFNGGTVPDMIRAEIMAKTNPKNYGIEFKNNASDAQN
jgi:hypothetical protein